MSDFTAASVFQGAKSGYFFSTGEQGVGYYLDTPIETRLPALLAAAEAAGGHGHSHGGAPCGGHGHSHGGGGGTEDEKQEPLDFTENCLLVAAAVALVGAAVFMFRRKW